MIKLKRRKRKRKSPQTRYVYLMERVSSRTTKSLLQGRREIKIGIAKNVNQRNRTVDLGIPGRVVILDKYKIKKASRVESELHKLFEKHNFTVRGAKEGSGGTEFFRLTNSQIRQARRILRKRSGGFPWFWVVTGSFALVYFVHYMNELINGF